jgi:hypothetical protein
MARDKSELMYIAILEDLIALVANHPDAAPAVVARARETVAVLREERERLISKGAL